MIREITLSGAKGNNTQWCHKSLGNAVVHLGDILSFYRVAAEQFDHDNCSPVLLCHVLDLSRLPLRRRKVTTCLLKAFHMDESDPT